jgi:hypothetical protein
MYLSPLESGLMLCCEGKGQVQGLDRTQPILQKIILAICHSSSKQNATLNIRPDTPKFNTPVQHRAGGL